MLKASENSPLYILLHINTYIHIHGYGRSESIGMDSRNRNRIHIREMVHVGEHYSITRVQYTMLVVSPLECTLPNSRYIFIDHLSSFKNMEALAM